MTPGTIRSQIVLEKAAWVRSMLDENEILGWLRSHPDVLDHEL